MDNKKCKQYSEHDWDLDVVPGVCLKCGASYLDTWPDTTESD